MFDKIHIFKTSFLTKFTFSKLHFSQNSHFINLDFFHESFNFTSLCKNQKLEIFQNQIEFHFSCREKGPCLMFEKEKVKLCGGG